MKRKFKIKLDFKNKIILIIIFVVFFDILIFNYFSNTFSKDILYLARINVEEISQHYLNGTIKKYLNINTNDYIKVNLVNNNIISVDIDNKSSNDLLSKFISDLEKNVVNYIDVNKKNYYNLEIIEDSNSIILYIPIGVALNNTLLAGIGPKIPIKANFLENIDAYVDVEVNNYGINNALIKLYVNINIKVIIEMPVDREEKVISYKYLIASKLINGKIPNILGNNLSNSSSIVNSSVN